MARNAKPRAPKRSGSNRLRQALEGPRVERIRQLLHLITRIYPRMPSAAEWELIARKAIDIERERDTEQYIVDRGKRPPRRGRKPVGPAERHLYVDMLAQEMITRKVSLTKASEVIGERIGRTGKQVRGYFRDSREYIITAYPQLVGK